MVTKRAKPLPSELAYRSTDTAKYDKKRERKVKLRRQALARLTPRYEGLVQPGQVWMLFAHENFGAEWIVVRVSSESTVELRGDHGVSWFLGAEELTKLGTLLTGPRSSVIPDTVGPGGEDTPEEGSVG